MHRRHLGGSAAQQMLLRHVHAQCDKVAYWRQADHLMEAFGKARPRKARFIGQGLQGPVTLGMLMHADQTARKMGIGQAGQYAAGNRSRLDLMTQQIDHNVFEKAIHRRLPAVSIVIEFVEQQIERRLQLRTARKRYRHDCRQGQRQRRPGMLPKLDRGTHQSRSVMLISDQGMRHGRHQHCARLTQVQVSFSEDDCTRQRGLKAVVQSSIERTVSGVRCTNDDLKPVLVALATDQPLDVRYRDHDLSGDWAGYRECHIKPDLLLIYRKSDADTLRLARLGSHSELFG